MSEWNAKLYDDKHSFVWKSASSLIDLLAPRSGEAILDVGCGTGHLTAQLADAGATVVGIDNSPAMIAEARRIHPALQFEIGDACDLPFIDRFDAVFSNAALHWIKQPQRVIRGIVSALKPGGRFVAEFGGKGNVRWIQTAMIAARAAIGSSPVESPWFFPSLAEYAQLLERAGLEVTVAALFERPTPLEGEKGMRAWIEMFGGQYWSDLPPDKLKEFFDHVEEALSSSLRSDGTWTADYRRLRVAARKDEAAGRFTTISTLSP